MKSKYIDYYKKHSTIAPVVFIWDIFWAKSATKRVSLMNRLRDYTEIARNANLLSLHQKINQILFNADKDWASHDYGEGYFYQSCKLINVRGLRNTEDRIDAMGLKDLVKDKTVIDIGCNSGFLSLSISRYASKIRGMEINPYLIDIANSARKYLGCKNVDFESCSFEDFSVDGPADVVFSFANHSTFDGNTKQSSEEYFTKCRSMIKKGGLLLFESHHPDYENKESLENIIRGIEKVFTIVERKIINKGAFFDRGRTFIVAKR